MSPYTVTPKTVGPQQHAEVLRMAFDQVCQVDDWKGPIHALIPSNVVGIYTEAIEFMTATKPTLQLTGEKTKDGHELIRVTAIGYRAGPAGP